MLPPYAELLRLELQEQDGEAPLLSMPFAEDVIGRPGFLHGGAIGGLLEVAAFMAVRHALGDAKARVKPINVTFDFMRGGRDKLTCAQGVVQRLGTRVANVEAIAWQEERDRPIAAARMNFLIVRSG